MALALLTTGIAMLPNLALALSIASPDCTVEENKHYFVVRSLTDGAYIADVLTDNNGQTTRQVSFLHLKGRRQIVVSKGSSALDPWGLGVIRDIEGMVASANVYTLGDVAQSLSYSGVEAEIVKMPRELVACLRGLK